MSLCGSREGTFAIESFNGLFAAGADVQSRGLVVCDGESFGLFHDAASAVHVDLDARGNAFAAVWAQRATSLAVMGSATSITGNGFAGVAAFDAPELVVEDATIRDTLERSYVLEGGGTVRAGDGLHVVGAASSTIGPATLSGNARVGLLIDYAGRAAGLELSGVVVDGEGDELGAIAQNGAVPAGWDDGVERRGATPMNDASFTGALDIAGAVGPSCLPDPSALAAGGLDSLLGP